MLSRLRSLRFRLTLIYVVIFGSIQTVLWIGVDALRTSYLYADLDAALTARAQSLADAVDRYAGDLGTPAGQAQLAAALEPFQREDNLYEITDASGASLARSRSLADDRLRVAGTDGTADALLLRTAPLIPPDTPRERAERFRIVRIRQTPANRMPYTVYVAASLAPVDRITGEVRRLLVAFVVVSLAIAAVTAWYLSRKALAPIGDIVRQARELGASRLEQRIPVPRSGDEIAEMVVVINEMLDRLETEFRNQQRFISDVSHELKTPVAVLLGEAQAVKREAKRNGTGNAFADTVEEEARRLLRTIESFLILTRARSGARPANHSDVSIESSVLDAIQRLKIEAQARGVRVLPMFNGPASASEPVVSGDSDLLAAMVEKLIQNGLRHAPRGGLVQVRVRTTPREVVLSVRDPGPSIPDHELGSVFDLFRQAGARSDRYGEGGLGLAIAKGVAQMHRGEVAVENLPEGGCEFTARLPLAHAAVT